MLSLRSKRPQRAPEVLTKAWETRRARYGENGMVRESFKKNPAYGSWNAARARCRSTTHEHYHYYGGRGIKFDSRWDKFEDFLRDMGPRPPGGTIERNDVNGNYEPSNCRWVTQKQQNRNTRATKYLTFNGRSQALAAWAEEVGLSSGTLWFRIKAGWTVERALTSPKQIKSSRRA